VAGGTDAGEAGADDQDVDVVGLSLVPVLGAAIVGVQCDAPVLGVDLVLGVPRLHRSESYRGVAMGAIDV
jgi:hypothetical protein